MLDGLLLLAGALVLAGYAFACGVCWALLRETDGYIRVVVRGGWTRWGWHSRPLYPLAVTAGLVVASLGRLGVVLPGKRGEEV